MTRERLGQRSVIPFVFVLALGSHALRAADCNLNRVEDTAEIQSGRSEDCDRNGIPDACDVVPLTFGTVGDPLPLGGEPQFLASGDLNGDGSSDLVVGTRQDPDGVISSLSVFLREGAGFAPEVTLVTDRSGALGRLLGLAKGDFDADGDFDLAALSRSVLQVYPNDGAGGFLDPLELTVSAGLEGLLATDLDDDGGLDLVCRSPGEGTITWYRNLGASRFGEPRTLKVVPPAGASTLARFFLEAGDFDGDGDRDLALTGGPDLSITILETVLEEGERGASITVLRSFPSGGLITAFAVGDIDRDGFPDLVSATTRRTVSVRKNLEGSGFGEPANLAGDVDRVGVADVDDDGLGDIVTGQGQNAMRILRSSGDGTFLSSQTLTVDGELFLTDDFDGNGDLDLAVVGKQPNRVTVLLQGERGGLSLQATRYPAHGRPHGIDVADFNGDGVLDLATANSTDQTSSIFLGRGDGTVGPVTVRSLGISLGGVVALDVDTNGTEDLVYRSPGGLQVTRGDGHGTFGEPEFVRIPTDSGPLTDYLGKADVDGDGNVDVLAPIWGTPRFVVHFGDGEGGLDDAQILSARPFPWAVAAGDIDGDGDADLVTANGTSSNVSVFLQESLRSFAPAISVPVEGEPRFVALGDFDQDGDLDAAMVNDRTRDVAVLLNGSQGVFDPLALRVPLGRDPASVAVADLDEDGLVDLVTTNDGTSISVLKGRGDGTFSLPQHFRLGENPRLTVSADMDSDGDLDLVVALRNGTSVSVLLNQLLEPVPREEFLTEICTPLVFETTSIPDVSSVSKRRTKYLLPARDDPTLLPTLFLNVTRFPLERDFLREVFPERFGDLGEVGFNELVLQRRSRDYFAGAIRRLRLENGQAAYGFDVVTDASQPDELLSREETREIYSRLRESFRVEPLIYFPTAPQAREAAAEWTGEDLPLLLVEEEPPNDVPPANPTFLLEIPAETVVCGVFRLAAAARGPPEELEFKSIVRLRAGMLALPTATETFPGNLFEEVLFGQERAAAEPLESGTFRVVRLPTRTPEEVAVYRFTYSQSFALPGGRHLELEVVSPLTFRAVGEEPLTATQTLPEAFFVALKGREPLQAKLDGESVVRYGSCTYESLPRWSITIELNDASAAERNRRATLQIEERYLEAESLRDTAPASVTRAGLTLDGERHLVTDYYNLVYSAARHNTLVDYWVVLDPPVAIEGTGLVYAVEIQAPEPDQGRPEAQASYLGKDFAVLSKPRVTGFQRTLQTEGFFVRGDATGDGNLSVVDAIELLRFLFVRPSALPCLAAADANDDGRVNIVDPIAVLAALFGRRDGLPEPFPECGRDGTEDGLSCRSLPWCP